MIIAGLTVLFPLLPDVRTVADGGLFAVPDDRRPDEGLILRPDNGNGESFVTKEMYVGKEIIAFPYIGGIIKPVLQHGKKMVIIVAMAMIVVGCWSLGRSRHRQQAAEVKK